MVEAKYTPGRDALGHFLPGNQMAKGAKTEIGKRLTELRNLWLDANSVEDMRLVKNELLKVVRECPIWDVKLRAIAYYLDRQLGRPTERVEMDVQSDPQSVQQVNNFNLSPEQLAIASDLVRQLTMPKVVVEAKPLEEGGG